MQFNVVALLIASAAVVRAIPHASPVAEAPQIVPYTGQDEESRDRQLNSQQVSCKAYLSLGHNDQSLAPCYTYCGHNKTMDKTSSGVSLSSVTCLSGGQGIPTYTDSNGKYNMGVCRCNLALLDEIVGDVVAALPAIAAVACEVLMDAWETVFKVGAMAIPGAGEIDAASSGMQAVVKGAQIIKKGAGKSGDFLKYMNKAACGQNQFTSQVDKVYDDITLGTVGSGGTGNLAADAAPASSSSSSSSSPAKPAAPATSSQAKPTSTTAPSTTTGAPVNALQVLQQALTNAMPHGSSATPATTSNAKRTSIFSA